MPTITSGCDKSSGSSTPSGDLRGSKQSSSAPSGALRSRRVRRTDEKRSKRPSPSSSSSAFIDVLPLVDDVVQDVGDETSVVPVDAEVVPVPTNGRDPYARRVTGGVSMFSESMSILSVGPSSPFRPPRDNRRGLRGPGWIGGREVSLSPVPLESSSGVLADDVVGTISDDLPGVI